MAPRPPSGGKGATGKGSAKTGKPKGGSRSVAPSASRPNSKPGGKRPPPVQVKSKPGQQASTQPKKKKKRVYTDKELGLPALNMITPAGVQKPRGKKKGKIFVDDRESMMTILAIVNAEKEGQIESKMIKSRQMEEIREARKKEAEARQEKRNEKLEETKKSFKKKRPGKGNSRDGGDQENGTSEKAPANKSRKRVSFA